MTDVENFWRGKRVLLTGHSGFKESWLALWLQQLGATVTGIALAPNTKPNLFELAHISDAISSHFCDVRDSLALVQIVRTVSPEIVFHLAAQPLVRASYDDPLATLNINVIGTANLLDALRDLNSVRLDLAAQMEKMLLLPPNQRIEMGMRGRAKMEAEFDGKFVIDKYIEALNLISHVT